MPDHPSTIPTSASRSVASRPGRAWLVASTVGLLAVASIGASRALAGDAAPPPSTVEVLGVTTVAPEVLGEARATGAAEPADGYTTSTPPTLSSTTAAVAAPATGPRVAVIGDSLTHAAAGELISALRAAGWDPVTVDGHPGAPIADRLARIRTVVATEDLDAIVLALGSNDARINVDTGRDVARAWANTQSAAFTALADAQAVPCVAWIGVNANTTTWELDRWGGWFNAWLRYYSAYGDWTARSAGRADWFRPDGVHLTDAGNQAYAGLVVDTLTAACGPTG